MATTEQNDTDTVDRDRRHLVLVLGGARSGKSVYAQTLAARLAHGRPVIYVATADAQDAEMRARIASHRAERPAGWLTIEESFDPAAALAADTASSGAGAVLLDCVTLLVSNLLLRDSLALSAPADDASMAEQRVWGAVEDVLTEYRRRTWSLVLVTNEVGMGIVPPYPLGRQYRDVLGRVNARLAQVADAVILLIAGLPVEVKSLAAAWEQAAAARLGAPDRPDPAEPRD